MIHELGWKSRILLAERPDGLGDVGDGRKPTQILVGAPTSRPAKPRRQPSIIASENAQPQHAVTQVVATARARHGSRCATDCPTKNGGHPRMTIAGTGAPPDVGIPPTEYGRGLGEGVDLPRACC